MNVFNMSFISIKVNWKVIFSDYVYGVFFGFVVFYCWVMNEFEDNYNEYEVGFNCISLELIGLWKYIKYGIRVLGFIRVGWGVISFEVVV